MTDWTEEIIEKFIVENREKFDTADPSGYHGNNFLSKLSRRIQHVYISILPHLTKLFIVSVSVTLISFFVWGNWLSPRRDQKTYGSISLTHRVEELKYKYYMLKLNYLIRFKYFKDYPEIRNDLKENLNILDADYLQLKKELKLNPKNKEIIQAMKQYYLFRIKTMYNILSIFYQKNDIEKLTAGIT